MQNYGELQHILDLNEKKDTNKISLHESFVIFISKLAVKTIIFHIIITCQMFTIISWSDSQQQSLSTPHWLICSTHFPLDKMAAILSDNIFKCIFLYENYRIPILISPKLVPRSSIDNKPALVQVMAWHRTGDKPLPEPTRTPELWEYPPLPHDYPYYWLISDPK